MWDEGERYTFEEYYGDTLFDLMHFFVHEPVMQWCYRRYLILSVSLPLKDVIDAWGTHAEPFWIEDWRRGTEMWRTDGPPTGASKVYRTMESALSGDAVDPHAAVSGTPSTRVTDSGS